MSKVALYRSLALPLIKRFTQPDAAHHQAMDFAEGLQSKPGRMKLLTGLAMVGGKRPTSSRLKVEVGGVKFDNPIILPAGFDKDARAPLTLYNLGFGSVIIGTVLERPQPGNPPPTIQRPVDGVLINRMGFPSRGMDFVVDRLSEYGDLPFPLGVSLGINKDCDHADAPRSYAAVAERLYVYGAYFVINVSSPNTPGLRKLQGKDHLVDIIQAVFAAMEGQGGRKPLFVKIAPELEGDARRDLVRVVIEQKINGIVATNTSNHPAVMAQLGGRWIDVAGGASGTILRDLSTQVVADIHEMSGGEIDIIAAGGISDLDSALDKFRAGAKALALYTGLIYQGPSLPTHLNRQLDRWMTHRGLSHVSEIMAHQD